jgi:predicted RNA-binding Zn-ribbon protein involved in translation (DUF1610 family)
MVSQENPEYASGTLPDGCSASRQCLDNGDQESILSRTGRRLFLAFPLPLELPTTTKLSQYCHQCGTYTKKRLNERHHHCPVCGLGTTTLIQRDLYSAWLASECDSEKRTLPSRGQLVERWQGMEICLVAALEALSKRAKEWPSVPRSLGVPRARARLPESFADLPQEQVILHYRRGRLEA